MVILVYINMHGDTYPIDGAKPVNENQIIQSHAPSSHQPNVSSMMYTHQVCRGTYREVMAFSQSDKRYLLFRLLTCPIYVLRGGPQGIPFLGDIIGTTWICLCSLIMISQSE